MRQCAPPAPQPLGLARSLQAHAPLAREAGRSSSAPGQRAGPGGWWRMRTAVAVPGVLVPSGSPSVRGAAVAARGLRSPRSRPVSPLPPLQLRLASPQPLRLAWRRRDPAVAFGSSPPPSRGAPVSRSRLVAMATPVFPPARCSASPPRSPPSPRGPLPLPAGSGGGAGGGPPSRSPRLRWGWGRVRCGRAPSSPGGGRTAGLGAAETPSSPSVGGLGPRLSVPGDAAGPLRQRSGSGRPKGRGAAAAAAPGGCLGPERLWASPGAGSILPRHHPIAVLSVGRLRAAVPVERTPESQQVVWHCCLPAPVTFSFLPLPFLFRAPL